MSHKPTLHRYILRLYDDDILEAEILDYIIDQPVSRRQELLRTFVKIGFGALVSGNDTVKVRGAARNKTGEESEKKAKKKNRIAKEDNNGSTPQNPATENDKNVVTQQDHKAVDHGIDSQVEDIDSLPTLPSGNNNKRKGSYEPETIDEIDELDPLARLAQRLKDGDK